MLDPGNDWRKGSKHNSSVGHLDAAVLCLALPDVHQIVHRDMRLFRAMGFLQIEVPENVLHLVWAYCM